MSFSVDDYYARQAADNAADLAKRAGLPLDAATWCLRVLGSDVRSGVDRIRAAEGIELIALERAAGCRGERRKGIRQAMARRRRQLEASNELGPANSAPGNSGDTTGREIKPGHVVRSTVWQDTGRVIYVDGVSVEVAWVTGRERRSYANQLTIIGGEV